MRSKSGTCRVGRIQLSWLGQSTKLVRSLFFVGNRDLFQKPIKLRFPELTLVIPRHANNSKKLYTATASLNPIGERSFSFFWRHGVSAKKSPHINNVRSS